MTLEILAGQQSVGLGSLGHVGSSLKSQPFCETFSAESSWTERFMVKSYSNLQSCCWKLHLKVLQAKLLQCAFGKEVCD